MSIYQKLVLLAIGSPLLIWSVGIYASKISESSVRAEVKRSYVAQSQMIMDEIDYVVHNRVEDWQAYLSSQIIQTTLQESNQELAEKEDVQAYIDEADLAWQTEGPKSNEMLQRLLQVPLSRELIARQDHLRLLSEDPIYGEVFVTNRYGANAAQTSRTSDFRQDDEEWWQSARKNGLHIGDVALDESSAVYSTDICLRIDDENGEFIGVLKAVLNVQEAINIIERHSQKGRGVDCKISLITSDGRVIHTTNAGSSIREESDQYSSSLGIFTESQKRIDPITGETLQSAFAKSGGHAGFTGLGWVLAIEYSSERLFAPVRRVSKSILWLSMAATLISALVGMALAFSLSKRVRRLTRATQALQDGKDYIEIPANGHDELAELAVSFNHMAKGLTSARKESVRQAEVVKARNATLELEINQRKIVEQERLELHEKLLKSSRQAGMAEVATGVLHNVGNVLNSVNVSANMLMDELTSSRVDRLSQAAKIINSQGDNVGDFLIKDERGRHFPGLLDELAKRLQAERNRQFSELRELVSNIDHIKQIVSAQQSLARSGGQTESVDIQSVVDDALRITQTGLSRHQIDVVRDYESLPAIVTDKHKVLQIIINLISNAKAAVCSSNATDKRIEIAITHGGNAKIRVRDNGIGIEPDNLTKIFTHGFSTKADGHGFGLHSCALAAQAVGGSLSVQSDGHAKGATFTLAIPIQREAEPCVV